MKLKIDFEIPYHKLDQNWPNFFLMGSCFATEQAKRMKSLYMNTYDNPFGIIYNPVSIQTLLHRIVSNKKYSESDFYAKDKYFSWEHHGKFKYDTSEEAVANSNEILDESQSQLIKADVVLITLGTSLVFKYQDIIVANCHKLPNKEFKIVQLSSLEVRKSILSIIRDIREINKTAEIIFTVSPIRHLRSGVVQSSRSKAVLISQLHEVITELTDKKLSYFPSFEIFMDELRDYRFAKEDLTHPTAMASEYIWGRFFDTYFNVQCKTALKDLVKLNQLEAHRSTDEELHKQTIANQRITLKQNYPYINIQ